MTHSGRHHGALGDLELGMITVSGENVDRILRRFLGDNRAGVLRKYQYQSNDDD